MAKRVKRPIIPRRQPRVLVSVDDPRLMAAIISQARAHDWDLLDLELTAGAILQHFPPSGALVTRLPDEPLVKRIRRMGIPIVRMGYMPHPEDRDCPPVLRDLVMAGALATDHFAERGFKHLAYVGSNPWSMLKPLYDGFVERATVLGLPEPVLFQLESRETADSPQAKAAKFKRRMQRFDQWLVGLPKPVGIFTYGDSRAASLCVMCHEAGINVPDEVALLGYGNLERVCEVSPVSLSSVDKAQEDMGCQAALLLHELMQGAPPPEAPLLVPPRGIVTRRSTEVLAVANPVVARAMRFIWDHFEQDVSVDAVAAEVGMSRRSLERAFQQALGRSINAELRRKRLEVCCKLLKTTDLPIIDLAPRTGFRSADFLHVSFRKTFGMTPLKWRVAARAGGDFVTS